MFMLLILLHFGYALGSQTTMPRITEHPSDLTVPRHDPATLNCAAEGQPPPHIEWYKDGLLVRPSASRVLLPAGALLFLRVAPRDAGVYWCSATNAVGGATSKNATMEVGVLREEFRVEPSNLRVAQGETALLECSPPRGAPEPQVSWNKDGHFLDTSTSNRIEIVDGGNLAIQNTRKSDEGSYQCVAKNAVGVRESAVAQLKVHVRPFLIRGPEDAVVIAGAGVVFSCEAGGDPVPDVLWRRTAGGGNMPLGRVHVLEDRSLRLEAITPEDEGEYSCEVDNAVGGITAGATLTVHSPPVITVRPTELTVEEGQDAVFSCGVRGKPAPTVFWIAESNHTLLLPGSEDGRYVVSAANEGFLILTVKEVQKNDDGLVVMCGAVNVIGSDSWFSRLTVVSPGDHPPPIIQLGPSNQTLPLHTPGILVCRASGEPTPVITWYKDGVPVNPDPPTIAVAEDGALTINDLVKSDEGLYTCVASSRRGKATWSATLRLEPRTNPNAAFFRSPEASTLPGPPSRPAMVNSTDSSITISWTRNNKIGSSSLLGYQVEMFSRSLSEKHSRGWDIVARRVPGPTYTQHYLRADTSYRFIVRAENSHGLSPASPTSSGLSLSSAPHIRDDTSVKEARASLSTGHVVELTSLQAVSSNSVKLAWEILSSDHVEGTLIFSLGLEPHANTTSMLTVLHTGDTSGFLVTGLRPYTRYQFFLVPFYKSVDGRPSNSQFIRTLEGAPSEPPSHLEAVLVNKSSVHLKWRPPSQNGQNGILIYYQVTVRIRDNLKEGVLSNVTVDAATPFLLLTNLTAGVVYTVQAAAATRVGVGPFSIPATLRLDPSTKLQGHFGQPIGMQPSLEVTEPDFLTETWFMALLGSMVVVMVLFFTAMLYVWRKQMLSNKGYLQEPDSNGGMLTPPPGLKALMVGLPQPRTSDTDLWIDSKCDVRDKCQLYSEVPQAAVDYAEVNAMQRDYTETSAAYAYTTLVPPSSACAITEGSGCNRGKSCESSYTSFGYYGRNFYSDNYNFLRNSDYSKIVGNGSLGVPVTMVIPQNRRRALSDSERETESSQLGTPPPPLPPQPPRYQRVVSTQRMRPPDSLSQNGASSGVNMSSRYGHSAAKTFSTFSRQNQSRNQASIYHNSTRSEPPR